MPDEQLICWCTHSLTMKAQKWRRNKGHANHYRPVTVTVSDRFSLRDHVTECRTWLKLDSFSQCTRLQDAPRRRNYLATTTCVPTPALMTYEIRKSKKKHIRARESSFAHFPLSGYHLTTRSKRRLAHVCSVFLTRPNRPRDKYWWVIAFRHVYP